MTELLVLAAQLHENRNLGAQHLGIDRLIKKVHRARIIPAKKMLVVLVSRNEKNRSVARTLAFPD